MGDVNNRFDLFRIESLCAYFCLDGNLYPLSLFLSEIVRRVFRDYQPLELVLPLDVEGSLHETPDSILHIHTYVAQPTLCTGATDDCERTCD
jgi:hypothetical protein